MVLAVLAIALALAGPWLAGPSGPAPEPPTEGVTSADAHTCSAEALARVTGLQVGATIADGWTIDAIRCSDEDDCTQVAVSRAPEGLTLRLCPHTADSLVPPVTHGSLDIFFDSPYPPSPEVPEPVIHMVLDAVVARLDEDRVAL